jgi:hypothetical protein
MSEVSDTLVAQKVRRAKRAPKKETSAAMG